MKIAEEKKKSNEKIKIKDYNAHTQWKRKPEKQKKELWARIVSLDAVVE